MVRALRDAKQADHITPELAALADAFFKTMVCPSPLTRV